MNIDDYIKKTLEKNVEHVCPKADSFEQIQSKIKMNNRRKFFNMNIKRSVIAASCGIVVACSAFLMSPNIRTVVADTWVKYVHGYTDMKEYNKPQENSTLQKDVGFKVNMPKVLDGNYKLMNTNINGLVDGSSGKLENKNSKELSGMYMKDGKVRKDLSLILTEFTHKNKSMEYKNIQKINIGGKTAYFRKFTIIQHRGGIEPTKQEWADQKAGKVVNIAVSGKKGQNSNIPERSTSDASELFWNDNGVNYVLSEDGGSLSQSDLINIAKGIMNSK